MMLTRNDSENMIHLGEHVISESWLKLVLDECYSKEKSDAKVIIKSFNVSKGNENSESVLSDLIPLSIIAQIDEEQKDLDLIIKLLPVDPFSRYFVTEAEFDLREIKFYTEVVPDIQKFQNNIISEDVNLIQLPIPKCYLGKYIPLDLSKTPAVQSDNQINESIIVMEDLKKQGYENVSFKNGLTLDQAKAAFVAISKLHALSLAMKVHENKSLREKYNFLFQTEKTSLSYQQLMERGFPQLVLFLEKKPDMKDIIDCLHNIRPKMKYLIEVLLRPKEPISLITHTDFWSNNLLFKGDECVVLDWQMVTCSQPTNDLALLIISSMPSKIRREHTTNLLKCYWDNFTENAVRLNLNVNVDLNYQEEDLFNDYKSSQLLALLLCIGSIDVALKDTDIEKRLIDVLVDLHQDGVLSADFVSNLR